MRQKSSRLPSTFPSSLPEPGSFSQKRVHFFMPASVSDNRSPVCRRMIYADTKTGDGTMTEHERDPELMKKYTRCGLNFIATCPHGDAEVLRAHFAEKQVPPLNENILYSMPPRFSADAAPGRRRLFPLEGVRRTPAGARCGPGRPLPPLWPDPAGTGGKNRFGGTFCSFG